MFKKRNIKSNNSRQRATERAKEDKDDLNESGSSSGDETVVVRKCAESGGKNPMVQKTEKFDKLKRKIGNGESDEENSGASSAKKPLVSFTYKSTRSGVIEGPEDQGATATVDVDTEHHLDHTALYEKKLKAQETGEAESTVYSGKDNYTMYYKPKEKPTGTAAALKGPVRAPNFLRATTRWDYAPDICKDYKETGFCGFGDSCKFLHDRSDYKFGWQLENEYTANHKFGKKPEVEDPTQYEISSDEEELPFKCLICRESFDKPVVTKCKHYFCEKCALAQCRKSMRCYACGTDTKGMFNPAKEIIARMNKVGREKKEEDGGSSGEELGLEPD